MTTTTSNTAVRVSFDSSGVQHIWDATSITAATECLRKYKYSILDSWTVDGPLPKDLRFGMHFATAVEHYYKHVVNEKKSHDEALHLVIREAMIETWDHTRTDSGERIPGTGMPWDSFDAVKNRFNLIRTIVWYFAHYIEDGYETTSIATLADGRPGAELSFQLPFSKHITYAGHLDRLAVRDNDIFVMDQKAQPLTSKVLTPNGWVPISSLTLGSRIATQDGTFTEVTGLFPKGRTPVYRVHFNDATHVDCAEDHLWYAAPQHKSKFSVIDFKQILNRPATVKYHIPLCEPVQHPVRDLPLHPYLLGVLLGDGYLAGGSIQLSTANRAFARRVMQFLPGTDIMKKNKSANHTWTISGGATLQAIRKLGLDGKLAAKKFIPDVYLYASEEQRRDVLNGLLDTDGSWNGNSRIFDSTSIGLTLDICELVRSLGGTARFRDRHDTAFRTSIRLPYLPTKVGRRYITRTERIANAETMCIKVAHPSHLYLTENHTVTHNTTGSALNEWYFRGFDRSIQMSGYSLAGEILFGAPIRGVMIDAAQVSVGGTSFMRGETFRTEEQLDEWVRETEIIIDRAQQATADNFFPRNTTACGYYGGCAFKDVCSMSPSNRGRFLKGGFKKREPWDPGKQR